MIRVDDPAEFVAAVRGTGRFLRVEAPENPQQTHTRLLVESDLPGSKHTLEGLISNGRLEQLALFEKPDPLVGPFFEERSYITPWRLEPALQRAVHSSVAMAMSTLGLTHGPVHAEVRGQADRVWILEIAAWSLGRLCWRALRYRGGRSLAEVLLLDAAGIWLPCLQLEPAASGVMMIRIPGARALHRSEGAEAAAALPGNPEGVTELPPGEAAVPRPEAGDSLGSRHAERGPALSSRLAWAVLTPDRGSTWLPADPRNRASTIGRLVWGLCAGGPGNRQPCGRICDSRSSGRGGRA